MVLIFSGAFAGRRAARGGLCLAVLLAGDLGLANLPWIKYWDYPDKYASNPVFDRLRDKPYEHRVASAPPSLTPELARLSRLYKSEWLQQQFPYYNIQSFETVEMSRKQEDMAAFMAVANQTNGPDMCFQLARSWQLAATRYVFAPVDFAAFFSQQAFLAGARLQPVARFGLMPKPGVDKVTQLNQWTPVLADQGNFALFEYLDALPRAKLYSRWQSGATDDAVLKTLFDPAFDPASRVFVAGDVPASPAAETNPPSGSVAIVHYAPKAIRLQADASAPSVLMLADHYDPGWKVLVDGRPAALLRCDFLLRGVYLPPGAHQVEFKFQPPIGWLYVSLAAVAAALLVLGILTIEAVKNRAVVSTPATAPPAVLAPVPAATPKASKPISPPAARQAPGGRRVAKR